MFRLPYLKQTKIENEEEEADTFFLFDGLISTIYLCEKRLSIFHFQHGTSLLWV